MRYHECLTNNPCVSKPRASQPSPVESHGPACHASSTYGTFQPKKKLSHLLIHLSLGWSPFSTPVYPPFPKINPCVNPPFTIFASPKEVEGMWPTGNDSSPGSPPPWTPPAAQRGVHEEPGKKGRFSADGAWDPKNGDLAGPLETPLGPYFKFIPHVEHVWCFPFLSERLHYVPIKMS